MKFTFNWLTEFVEIKAAPTELAEILTMSGLEVESVSATNDPETRRDDWIFEVAVTPNRGDCLGVRGLAREVAALTGGKLKPTSPTAVHRKAGTTKIKVSIQNPRLCSRYSAAVMEGLRIGPSPAGVRFRLEACGIRAINNVVDITNYVMLETGQPLHAFDLDRLPAREIVIGTAKHSIKFTTLDGVEQDLVPEDLLIWAGDVPVALAGVMGGVDSEVSQNTRSILLESANFDATTVRRTAKRLGLHSEASHRFERGVDPDGTIEALARAASMLADLPGGTSWTGVVDRYPRRPKVSPIVLREERVEKLLGIPIDAKRAEKLLQSVGIKTRRRAGKIITAVAPPYRADLTREADLIEELARLVGYERIPSTLPPLRPCAAAKDERLAWERRMRAFLAGEGFVEVINLPFTSEEFNRSLTGPWEGRPAPVTIVNPLVKDFAEMRFSLIPGLLENLRLNMAQRVTSFWAYHLGKVFRQTSESMPEEKLCIAGILYGPRARRGLRGGSEEAANFLYCKGLVEGFFDLLGMAHEVSWAEAGSGSLHPGRSALALARGQKIGYLGQLHPEFCEALSLPNSLIFELDLEKSLEYAPRQITTRSLPRFPAVGRDFALVVERDFQSERIVNWVKDRGDRLIEHIEVFDEYRGAPIPEGKKSLAYKISYRAEDRTLTDAEINALHHNLVSEIERAFGAEMRS